MCKLITLIFNDLQAQTATEALAFSGLPGKSYTGV
jgi:hypothetical protein